MSDYDQANSELKKQGLKAGPAGLPPKAGDEGFMSHDTAIQSPSGRETARVGRASSDDLGGNGPLHESVLSDMVNKYSDRVMKRYSGR